MKDKDIEMNVKKAMYEYLIKKAEDENRDDDYPIYLQGSIGYKP